MDWDASNPLNWDDVPEDVRRQIEYSQNHPEQAVPRRPRRD
jgi:hypothetical protein